VFVVVSYCCQWGGIDRFIYKIECFKVVDIVICTWDTSRYLYDIDNAGVRIYEKEKYLHKTYAEAEKELETKKSCKGGAR